MTDSSVIRVFYIRYSIRISLLFRIRVYGLNSIILAHNI